MIICLINDVTSGLILSIGSSGLQNFTTLPSGLTRYFQKFHRGSFFEESVWMTSDNFSDLHLQLSPGPTQSHWLWWSNSSMFFASSLGIDLLIAANDLKSWKSVMLPTSCETVKEFLFYYAILPREEDTRAVYLFRKPSFMSVLGSEMGAGSCTGDGLIRLLSQKAP